MKTLDQEIQMLMAVFETANEFDMLEEMVDAFFKQAKKDILKITPLAISLNWLCWKYAETDEALARYFDKMWKMVDAFVFEGRHFKKSERQYYLLRTD